MVRQVDLMDRSSGLSVGSVAPFEPFFGGGLVTALSIPIIARVGLMPSVIATMLLLTVTLALFIRSGRSASEPLNEDLPSS